jgi:Fic family protein
VNLSEFVDPSTGKLVEINSLREAKFAFIPTPLPPNWIWPSEFWPLLMRAHRAIAALDGIGAYLPDPQLLLRPLQYREAVRSSNLEGTFTPPLQQALFEFDPATIRDDEPTIDAYREISNYGRALRLYFEDGEKTPVSLHLIKQLHQILLENVRGSQFDPGNFRRVQNQIGRPLKFVPPPPEHLIDCLDALEKYLRLDLSQFAPLHSVAGSDFYDPIYDPLVNAFLVHYQFETIHPFLDGNGRVGRLLMSIMITENCRMSAPWLQMSPYFDANRDEYLDRLYAVSTRGQWSEWIEFCLNGVIIQAEDTQVRCANLINMQQDFRHRLDSVGGNLKLVSIIDNLFRSPVITIPWVTARYNVTYPTARKWIESLIRVGIIQEMEIIGRTKTFVCQSIIDIVYQ